MSTTWIKQLIVISSLTILTSGCSNKGFVDLKPVPSNIKHITILKDKATRATVQPIIEEWLYKNGYKFNVATSYSQLEKKDNVLEYEARWSWDFVPYMRTAEMSVTTEGVPLGIAKFDAIKYGGFGKFGNAEARLKTMLDALFGKITREEADVRAGKE